MKLTKGLSGLLLLVLGVTFSTAQATHYGKYDRYKKPKEEKCDYDLRDGAFYHNANNRPTDGKGNPTQNALIVFPRGADGTLGDPMFVKSGGYGNQAGIVTSGQNSVIHTGSGNYQYVLMTNPGFNPVPNKYGKVDKNGSVSVFRVGKCSVRLTDVKSTRGQEPRAVTRDRRGSGWYKRDLVYVVNAGSGEVEFNGCPGLPEGFLPPTGQVCGPRAEIPEKEQDATSIIGYRLRYGKLYYIRGSHRDTADPDGDPAQISFINEGRQVIVAQRATFFALGDGTEPDNVEVFNLDKWGRPGKPVVSTTTGNDPFGFSVFARPGKDYDDCVLMSHGSFQQRDQGGVGVFTVDKKGIKQRIIPNKPDGGSDTCWTAISRQNVLYTSAFFDSEISIRQMDPATCNLTDGGPPVVVSDDGVPGFGGPANLTHRITSSAVKFNADTGGADPRGDDFSLRTDQLDFLYEAGGLDIAISKGGKEEYLYTLWAPLPFYTGRDNDGNFLWNGAGDLSVVSVFRIIQGDKDGNCVGETKDSIYADGCRPGDVELVQRVPGIPSQGFGAAAY